MENNKLYKNCRKKVCCLVCGKYIRSDTLKRHSKVHTDLLSLNDEEVIEELKLGQSIQMEREERRHKIEEIARTARIPTPKEIAIAECKGDLREDLLRDKKYYFEKIELGKKIDDIISEGVILEESLKKERKLALDLYRKQRPRFNILDVKLRPWQEQALQLVYLFYLIFDLTNNAWHGTRKQKYGGSTKR